jgi:hypothetical protein
MKKAELILEIVAKIGELKNVVHQTLDQIGELVTRLEELEKE